MNTASRTNSTHELSPTHRRSMYHDYKGRGIYLVTFNTENRQPLLGCLCGDCAENAYIQPTTLGQEVLRCWQAIPSIQRHLASKKSQQSGIVHRREIQLLAYQLMPDHFHGIIFIKEDMDVALGHVLHGFMVGCTKAYHKMLSLASTPKVPPSSSVSPSAGSPKNLVDFWGALAYSPSHPVSVPPSAYSPSHPVSVSPSAYSPSPKPSLWQKGYHDRPLTRDGQLQNMIDYVHDNPRRLFIRRHHAECYHVQKGINLYGITVSAVGNILLLDNPLHAVHVRRRFSEQERRAYMNQCILAARQGKVLISPFISEYEKKVRDVALQEGLPVIQICNEAFHDYYKPSGELFDICTSGRLLLLSTRTDPSPFSHRITREECQALNNLAEYLSAQQP